MVLYLFYMFMEQLIKQSKYSIFSANQGNWRQNCTSPWTQVLERLDKSKQIINLRFSTSNWKFTNFIQFSV